MVEIFYLNRGDGQENQAIVVDNLTDMVFTTRDFYLYDMGSGVELQWRKPYEDDPPVKYETVTLRLARLSLMVEPHHGDMIQASRDSHEIILIGIDAELFEEYILKRAYMTTVPEAIANEPDTQIP